MADHFLTILNGFDPSLSLNYNKHYIGLVSNSIPNNFVVFKPKKAALRVEIRLPRSDDITEKLEQSGLDLMDYDARSGYYRIRLVPGDEKKHTDVIADLLRQAYERAAR